MPHTHASDNPILGIALSTMDGRLLENQKLVKQIAELKAPVVVVNQHERGHGLPDQLGLDAPHVRVMNTPTRGLSKSRNLALHHLNASWGVLCDDDVLLDLEGLRELESHLEALLTQQMLPMVVCQLWHDHRRPWRDYDPTPWRVRGWTAQHVLRMQKVNSMELVVPSFQSQINPIHFHEALGLGSASGVPAGEEGLLLADHLRAGGEVAYFPLKLRLHADDSTGSHMNPQTALSMGVVHRATFPSWTHPLLLLRMVTKTLLGNSGGKRSAWAYCRGFLRSRVILNEHHAPH